MEDQKHDLSGNTINEKKKKDLDYSKKYCKEWYKKNKEYHNKYCCEKVKCECGDNICRSGLIKHKKSNKHFANLYKEKNI